MDTCKGDIAMANISFAFPVDCVMLTDTAGKLTNEGLEIDCILNAPYGRNIPVNGVQCTNRTMNIMLKSYCKITRIF